jgi:hypothetical protein
MADTVLPIPDVEQPGANADDGIPTSLPSNEERKSKVYILDYGAGNVRR